ncbi:hypothetical protein J437_LFUL009893 [Ladona fulva]|uniref:WD repeat-containing protein 79 n=1 Tax=Ladona fulva TaxID=123851 RepID=A0A8K0P0Q3_LADFU|nr:hypothetical protein J437_LFUL009893 [Ladona fulva]
MDEEVECNTDLPVLEEICPEKESSESVQHDSDSGKPETNNDNVVTCYCPTAPDGTCLLTSSADNCLRIFNLPMQLHCKETWSHEIIPEMKAVLKMREGGLIYDYCWYPPILISTSKDSPVHLWNAYTGNLCGSYIPTNQMEEIVSAYSVAFSYSGDKIYCGFCNLIRVFDTSRPGNESETRILQGIVSCFSMHPTNEKIYAAGNYLKSIAIPSSGKSEIFSGFNKYFKNVYLSKSLIIFIGIISVIVFLSFKGIYAEPDGSHLAQLTGHIGGVTHLRFSPDGTKLYSGGRKDPYVHCWDMRKLGQALFLMERDVETNQRITFDISPDGRFFFSGNTSGKIKIWDVTGTPISWDCKDGPLLQVATEIQASKDCVNGVSIHQQYPILASSTGQWHFKEPVSDSEEEDEIEPMQEQETTKDENIVSFPVDTDPISLEGTSEKPKEVQTSHGCKKSRPLLKSKNPELIDNSVKLWWIGNIKDFQDLKYKTDSCPYWWQVLVPQTIPTPTRLKRQEELCYMYKSSKESGNEDNFNPNIIEAHS